METATEQTAEERAAAEQEEAQRRAEIEQIMAETQAQKPTARTAHRAATEAIVESLDAEDAIKAKLTEAKERHRVLTADLEAQTAAIEVIERDLADAQAETVTIAQDGITVLQQLVASRSG